MADKLKIGSRIASLRKKAGFTQAIIASKLKVSRSLVGQIEKDLTRPNLEFLAGFTKLVGCSYNDILIPGEHIIDQEELLSFNRPESPEFAAGIFANVAALMKERIKNLEFKQAEIFKVLLDQIWEELDRTDKSKLPSILRDKFHSQAVIKKLKVHNVFDEADIDLIVSKFIEYKGY